MQCATLAMLNYEWLELLGTIVQVVWVFAFGACIGSLLNVLVYRLPLGLNVVTPQSRCPNCETRLTWRENVPIFGWLFLRGRCAFCRTRISAEYPIVETFTAVLWSLVFVVLYTDHGRVMGVPFGWVGPSWGGGGFAATWPLFIIVVGLFSCLIAVTLIDARTFHIPMQLNWTPAILAIVGHTGWAIWRESHGRGLPRVAHGWSWAIATPGPAGWWWIGGSIGACFGLLLANVLMSVGVIKRSFADYDEWASAEEAKQAGSATGASPGSEPVAVASAAGSPQAEGSNHDAPEMWVMYPHARREMIRELIFLAPCIGLGLLGAALAANFAGPWDVDPTQGTLVPRVLAPLWLDVLSGVLMGYVVGGGLVWLVRIGGTLSLGKEAMGLGDVHLMAAVGACLGWVDSCLGFVGAAFVGAGWALMGVIFGGALKRHMPLGPHLAIATVLVWFLKPLLERLLGVIMHTTGPLPLP